MSSAHWRVESRTAEAALLHASWPSVDEDPTSRAVAVCAVTGPCVVLGSAQREDSFDPERLAERGLSTARRRTGGGAVLVSEGDPLWIDLWLPAGDPLVAPDLARSFDWLGDTWLGALERTGARGLRRHEGAPLCGRWSSLVCFGGIGRGEVVTAEGRKVVGLAQRRTRSGSWFQCACPVRWDPGPIVETLALDEAARARARDELRSVGVGIAELPAGAGSGVASLRDALIDLLP